MSTHILHVDDEPSLLDLSKEFLEMDGDMIVDLVEDPIEAIRSNRIDDVDVIISDYQMPSMNGLEFLERVRAKRPDVPFILYTGKGREEVVIRAFDLGADAYMQKGGDPISQYTELKYRIRQLHRRSKAERRVHEANERLRNLFDNSHDAMFIIDSSDGRIVQINAQAVRMFDLPEETLIGMTPWDLSPSDVPGNDICEAKRMIESSRHGHQTFQWVHMRPHGKGFPALVNMTANDPEGHYILCSIRDLTERTRIRSELMSTRNQMSTLLDVYNDMIIVTDDEFIVEAFNERVVEKLGSQRDEVIGRRVETIFDRSTTLAFSDLHDGGRPSKIRVGRDCGDLDLEVTMRCYEDGQGRHRLIICKDISDELRKDSHIETMVARGRMLERIIDNSAIAAFHIRRSDHALLYVSKNISLFDITPEGLVSDEFGITGIIDQLPTRPDEGMIELCHRTREGRCLEINIWPESPSADEQCIAGTMYDVTDRMHTLDALEMAHTQLSLLTSISRHDYYNILTSIDGYNGLALSADDLPSAKVALERQRKAISQMSNDLRINRRLYSINWDKPKWVDIGSIVDDIMIGDGHEVDLINDSRDLELFTIPMIGKVISNIVGNSLDHGGRVTSIRVRHEISDIGLRLLIEDDGKGIRQELKDDIFKKGFGDRNGFGLFLSKSILETTGFDITEEGDHGARFVIHVPPGRFRIRSVG